MWRKQTSHSDRLGDAAKAKQALLENARAKDPRNDPGFAERQAKRKELADARVVRLAEQTRWAEEKEAKLLAEQQALEAEATSKQASETDRKAQRDAKYAARKARQSKKR